MDEPVLECQACGDVISTLSDVEAQDMSFNPYNWIAYCNPCSREGAHLYAPDRI